MSERPKTQSVQCPECEEKAIAVIPRGSSLVAQAVDSDGKVRVTCRACGEQFLAHYRNDP